MKSEIWTILHCLGLGNETMVCAVCLSIFLWIVVNIGWGNGFATNSTKPLAQWKLTYNNATLYFKIPGTNV